jgi:Ca2+-binding EF-hand superfamily protein
MATATHFEKAELMALQKKFFELSKREGNPNTISLAEFREALAAVGVHESDTEILERLFTMCDTLGTGQIFFKDFLVGLAPMIHGTVEEKLNCEC